jgi:D-alanyl-D-alanine carboxypeptidase
MHLGRVLRWQHYAAMALVAILAVGTPHDQAAARGSSHKTAKSEKRKGPIHGANYRPPYAAIVIDDKSGQVLHETSADEPRHPASLTKIMTLYLLFEQLDAGKFKLDSRLDVSRHAAVQNPTKLGLKVGGTISVEEAIKGLVTRSANDAAVVVAEAIGGTEEEFSRQMTTKARMLGMTSTTYMNASGLPDLEQITTARDQAVLGRAIQHRFPVYYQYFATPSFRYRNQEIRNHNALLGNVKGVDGIKTGYTEASGYNLVTSCRRDDRHIVAVVLGGRSNAARDSRMRELIELNLPQASAQRTAPIVTELGGQDGTAVPVGPELVAPRPVPAAQSEPPGKISPVPEGSREELSAKPQGRALRRNHSKAGESGRAAAQRAQPAMFNIFAPAPASAMSYRPDAH